MPEPGERVENQAVRAERAAERAEETEKRLEKRLEEVQREEAGVAPLDDNLSNEPPNPGPK